MIDHLYSNTINKKVLKNLLQGKIFKISDNKNLKDYIENLRNEFQLKYLEDLNFEKCKKINKRLIDDRENFKISFLFLDIVKKLTNNELEFTQIEKGMLRIFFNDDLNKKSIEISSQNFNNANYQGIYPENLITNVNALPHRDLNRPHYSQQFNFWFSFFDLKKEDSLIFFPEVFKKNIMPSINSENFYDTNKDNLRIQREVMIKNYDQFRLGKNYSCELNAGDLLLFNSEQFHCSPLTKKNRISGEIRFAINCFDKNNHYRKQAFFNISNLLEKKEHSKQFTDLVDNTFDDCKHYSFDYILEKIKNSKINDNNRKKIIKILEFISIKSKNFYLLEAILDLKLLSSFSTMLLIIRYNYYSFKFYLNDLTFKNNPVNFFDEKYHKFNQPVPEKYFLTKALKFIFLRNK